MKRREFLIKTSQAMALAAVTGGTGLLFHNRQTVRYGSVISNACNFGVPSNPDFPGLSLAKSADPIQALNLALDAVGGIRRFVKAGERVTIKPNIGWDRSPEQAANTNPLLVGEMVRLCLDAGAAEVIVSDITCNEARRTFIRSGIRDAAEKAGAKVLLPAEEDFLTVNINGKLLTVWPVLKHFVQTDRLINMPIVKHHSLSACTVSMKNLYGILGGRRSQLHQQIDQSIVDLAAFCRPTLTVVDATRVLLRGGPQGGSLNDVAIENSVICTTDPVAADSRSAEFLGLVPERVSHIVLAEKSGIGTMNYRSLGYKEIAG